jgi:hypothetical protein
MYKLSIGIALIFLITSCTLTEEAPPLTPTLILVVTPDPTPLGWISAEALMSGICFESAFDAAGRVFIFRNRVELDTFYDLADNSRLCRRPVTRSAETFPDGRVIAGVWSRAIGCDARHEVIENRRDTLEVMIRLRLIVEGNCPYQLVEPFWIAIDQAQDLAIQLVVESS